jgi:hypothetical protein
MAGALDKVVEMAIVQEGRQTMPLDVANGAAILANDWPSEKTTAGPSHFSPDRRSEQWTPTG